MLTQIQQRQGVLLAHERSAIRWPDFLAISAVIFLLTALINWRLRFFVPDDAYIHIRIASHFATTGLGWFNDGERVMATSSPLWTALLGALFALFGERPWILPVLNAVLFALAWAMSCFILISSMPHGLCQTRRTFVYASAFLMCVALLGYCSISQMETLLAICLVLAGVTAFLVGSDWAPAFLVLSAFTRYELVLCCAAFLAASLMFRALRLRALLRASLITLAGVLFLLVQYRTVIPNSVHAKAVGYSITRDSVVMNLLWDGMTEPQYGAIIIIGWFVIFIALLLAIYEVIRTQRNELRDRWPVYTALASGVLISLAYVAHPTFVFFWYRPLYTVPIVLVILYKALQQPRTACTPIFTLLVALWGYHYWLLMPGIFVGAYNVSPNFVESARVHRYLTVGRILNSACPSSTLLSAEIGGLGETFHGRVIDGFGLATPEAIQFQPLSIPDERPNGLIGGFSAGIVNLKRPDIIVSYEVFARAFLRSPLLDDYRKIQIPMYDPSERDKIRNPSEWGGSAMYVFLRKDGSCHLDPGPLLE